MIYWHVERRAACIYSQLKRCSSSEVAAMIEGVLRHCTDLEVQKNYVDSHGQSHVAFAFCHLLGFELMPRLKGIASQKLNPDFPPAESAKPLAPTGLGGNFGFHAGGYMLICNKSSTCSCSCVGVLF